MQAKGGALGFVQVNPSSVEEISIDSKTPDVLLAYMNGDHEYVLYDPYSKDAHEVSMSQKKGHAALELKGEFPYNIENLHSYPNQVHDIH